MTLFVASLKPSPGDVDVAKTVVDFEQVVGLALLGYQEAEGRRGKRMGRRRLRSWDINTMFAEAIESALEERYCKGLGGR